MLGSLGMPELIVIFIIALVIFGPRKLPELGRSLGKGLAEFKKATNDIQNTFEEEVRLDAQRTTPPPVAVIAPPAAAVAPPLTTPFTAHDADVVPTTKVS
jgi:sec-independent protein translocase protein TatA